MSQGTWVEHVGVRRALLGDATALLATYDPVVTPAGRAVCRGEGAAVDSAPGAPTRDTTRPSLPGVRRVAAVTAVAAIAVVAVVAARVRWGVERQRGGVPRATPGQSASASGLDPDTIGAQIERSHPPHTTLDRARNATVHIETPHSAGTGFFVSEHCDVLTTREIASVDPRKSKADEPLSVVVTADAVRHAVTSQRFSEQHDVALLHIDGHGCPTVPFATAKDLPLGSRVFTIGGPAGPAFTMTPGVLSRGPADGQLLWIQSDAAMDPRSSGSPLVTEDGAIIGVRTTTALHAQGLGFAIPVELALREFGLATR